MSNADLRPRLRELFFSVERRPEVYFYTSNEEKFLQGRTVFSRVGLQLRHFSSHTEPYLEDYQLGTEGLLSRAVQQVADATSGGLIFFVEDTSLRIDALSSTEDFPGLAVKEWYRTAKFEDVDRALIERGNNRAVTVKSDIALHLPGVSRPIFLHGEVRGNIANEAPGHFHSVQYPWLTSSTFNGWFIPDGATRRLGEMSLEESWQHDFRVRSLLKVVDRLEEYTAAMNLPAHAYTRRRRVAASPQLQLLAKDRRVVVVVGRTCAGKSVFGSRATESGLTWVEASDIVRGFYEKQGGAGQAIGPFAVELLAEKGNDFVARRVLQLMDGDPDAPVVITGFRTLEEIELIRTEVPTSEIVLIEASERTRFERYVARGRPGATSNIRDFERIDAEQWKMGLLSVADDFADIRVVNEGTLDEYFVQIDAVLTASVEHIPGVSRHVSSGRLSERSQLKRCLIALADDGRSMDCNEVAKATRGTGIEIRYNNVNKILKRYPSLAIRSELSGEKVRYRITETGRTFLRMIESELFR